MKPAADSDLRQLLARRIAAAVEVARQSGGNVPQAELESLDRLAWLIDLHDRIGPKTPPRRAWAFATILVVTLGVLSALLFMRTRNTTVELEIDATQVEFTLPSEQILFQNLELTSLGASGLARFALPAAVTTQWGGAGLDEPAPPMVLTVAESEGRRGSIGIDQIRPKGQAQVDLRLVDAAGQYRLTLRGAATTIEVGVVGPITVQVAGVGETLVDFAAPKGIVLEPAATAHLDLVFRDPARVETTPQVPVVKPSFWRVDEYGDRQVSVFRELSTILGGTLYFESLGETSRQLRRGEILRFEEAAGEMRTLRLLPDRLSFSFHGRVGGMTSGEGDERRSLMPTWLDLLRAQHGLELLWGSALYIAGVAMAVLRWWRGTA